MAECENALAVAHLLRPGMKNLILTAEPYDYTDADRDAVLTAFADPKTLIATATGLMEGAARSD